MDYIPDNMDVNKYEQTQSFGPVEPVDEETVLEEEITSVAVDNLVSPPTDNIVSSYIQNDREIQNNQQNFVHFSDGTMTRTELNMETALGDVQVQPSTEEEQQQIALPDNLIEVYRNLGILGKILTGGSLVTLRVLQAFGSFGESVIDLLGITRPKYEYEINYAKHLHEQEERRNDKIHNLYSSWQGNSAQATEHTVSEAVSQVPQMSNPPQNTFTTIPPSTNLPSSSSIASQQYSHSYSTGLPTASHTINQQYPPMFIPPLPQANPIPTETVIPQSSALLTPQSFSTLPDTPADTLPPISTLGVTSQNENISLSESNEQTLPPETATVNNLPLFGEI